MRTGGRTQARAERRQPPHESGPGAADGKAYWTIEIEESLTLSPSLLCIQCGQRGWVRRHARRSPSGSSAKQRTRSSVVLAPPIGPRVTEGSRPTLVHLVAPLAGTALAEVPRMPDADPPDSPVVAYLACPIHHGDAEPAFRCIRRRFSLLMDDRTDLIELVRSTGTLEQGEHDLTGWPLLRRADAFGARDWFVLDGETAWYVQERGGIGYARNITSAGIRATGWAVRADRVADAVRILVAAARALQAECKALGLPWQDVARRRHDGAREAPHRR